MDGADVRGKLERIREGGSRAAHDKLAAEGKLFARRRIELLFDAGSFVEDAAFANAKAGDLPADGVVTGHGRIDGRPVCVMANDSTVKAGSWGKRTVEKIIRIQETAERLRVPLVYLVDSAGARITDQIEMFPGRRGAGRIFYNQVRLSGLIPQVCLLFGPSAAGGAYIPAFCDVRLHGRGQRLDVPRLAAHGRDGDRREDDARGDGRRAHALLGVGLRGPARARRRPRRSTARAPTSSYLPLELRRELCRRVARAEPAKAAGRARGRDPASDENQPFDIFEVIDRVIDAGSFFEMKKLFARELRHRLRAHRRPAGRHRREPAEVEGRRALRRLGRQGRALHQAVRRVRRPAALPGRRARAS